MFARPVWVWSSARMAGVPKARDDLSIKFFELSDRVASYDWDIPSVHQYHRMMSQDMNREEEALIATETASASAA